MRVKLQGPCPPQPGQLGVAGCVQVQGPAPSQVCVLLTMGVQVGGLQLCQAGTAQSQHLWGVVYVPYV